MRVVLPSRLLNKAHLRGPILGMGAPALGHSLRRTGSTLGPSRAVLRRRGASGPFWAAWAKMSFSAACYSLPSVGGV